MKHHFTKISVLSLTIACILALGIFASGAGTTNDPLITLSYLNGTFRDNVVNEVVKTTVGLQKEITSSLNSHGKALKKAVENQEMTVVQNDFVLVDLAPGKTMNVAVGTQILWLSGTATVQNSVLTDTTGGGKVAPGGQLLENHLYISTGVGTVTATGAAQCLISQNG